MYRAVRIGERDGTRFKFEESTTTRRRAVAGTLTERRAASGTVGEIRRRPFRFVTVYVLGMFS